MLYKPSGNLHRGARVESPPVKLESCIPHSESFAHDFAALYDAARSAARVAGSCTFPPTRTGGFSLEEGLLLHYESVTASFNQRRKLFHSFFPLALESLSQRKRNGNCGIDRDISTKLLKCESRDDATGRFLIRTGSPGSVLLGSMLTARSSSHDGNAKLGNV